MGMGKKRASNHSRTKGHSFERYIAQRLRPYDLGARRNVSETQFGSVDIVTKLPFGIQCKRFSQWRTTPITIYNQAVEGVVAYGHNGIMPIGIIKIDRQERTLCMLNKAHFKIFFADLLKHKKFKLVRRRVSKPRKKRRLLSSDPWKATEKGERVLVQTPHTLICEAFAMCRSDEHPVVLWTNLHKDKDHISRLYIFDFELLIKQIEKIYGKEENSSSHIQC